MARIRTKKITDDETRQQAFKVIEKVYLQEKKWIKSAQDEIPADIGSSKRFSWFLATVNNTPAGVIRLFYDPPLQLPENLKLSIKNKVDLEEIIANSRFVEIGRFMILPQYRKKILVALRLMRAAVKEVVERDYTHFITDVFEGEINSPYKFHTQILGFEVIGTHLHGELNCSCTRIILTLDILKAYKRLKERNNKIYKYLTEGIQVTLDKKLVSQ